MTDSRRPDEGPGVFSQTQIRHLMRTEFARAQRYGYPLACLLLELEGLAPLRDRLGYEAKEGLVDDLVAQVRGASRTCDYLGRTMEDRLMIVLPHTDRAGARAMAQRLVATVEAMPRPVGADDLPVRLLCGSSHLEGDDPLFFDVMLERADAALERAATEGGIVQSAKGGA